jgi:RNA polymerase sigma-70 factor, ECF subfamily
MSHEDAQVVACIPSLRRYARALLGDSDAADDLVQDTLRKGWEKLALWRREGDMRVWLFGIMHNTYVDQRRKVIPPMTSLEDEELSSGNQENQAGQIELLDLQSALQKLPDEQREVLLLVALEGLSYREVSKAMQLPLGTVMSRLSRGRERLRALMQGRPAINQKEARDAI